jgi:hypothetical protein
MSHPVLGGRCARILKEHGEWRAERAAQQLSLRCSPGVAPLATAQWLEGFLQGGGTLLRRTVSTFSAPERRGLGERAGHGGCRGRHRSAAGAARAVYPAHAARNPATGGSHP